jgi:hypothetical protein
LGSFTAQAVLKAHFALFFLKPTSVKTSWQLMQPAQIFVSPAGAAFHHRNA